MSTAQVSACWPRAGDHPGAAKPAELAPIGQHPPCAKARPIQPPRPIGLELARIRGICYAGLMRCPGFRFAASRAGIKESGGLDLAAVVCDRPASAAAVFTQNRLPAAPVRLSKSALARSGGKARAAIVNSGNANACTGKRGMSDARRMARRAATTLDAPRDEIQIASTGVIGAPLPIDAIDAQIPPLLGELCEEGFFAFAEAILTTDRGPKTASRAIDLGGGRQATLLGCTKGAGMIAPNMATTLSFAVTDAAIDPAALAPITRGAIDATFNAITIDGDTSTNDTFLVLAGGDAGNDPEDPAAQRALADALGDLSDELARALMADGEGVHHVVDIRVSGAASPRAAERIAHAIARSPLVKTAIAGCDPNWGRILCAAGNAGAPLRERDLSLAIGDVPLVRDGVATPDSSADERARAAMRQSQYAIALDLGAGEHEATALACDLSHEYVSINADYRT